MRNGAGQTRVGSEEATGAESGLGARHAFVLKSCPELAVIRVAPVRDNACIDTV